MQSHPAANLFPLLDGAEFEALCTDVKAHGLIEPIVTYENLILDGRNRYRACEAAGVAPRFRPWAGEAGTPVRYAIAMNVNRRHLTASQRAVAATDALPLLQAEAKERQAKAGREHASEGGKAGGRGRPKPDSPVGTNTQRAIEPEPRRARDDAAALFGVSPCYVERAKALAKADQALAEKVRAGKKTLTQASKEVKRAAQVEAVTSYTPPTGRYGILVVDPPWHYEKRPDDPTHRGACPYPTMTLDEIKALTLPADDDCILWLWTTNAFMREAFDVLDAWGFAPKTILTWLKDRMGLGDWLRGQTEHCILAVKGHPVVTLTNQTTALLAPAGSHSSKPDEFYALVESLCPQQHRAELFARQRREGWETHGAELPR